MKKFLIAPLLLATSLSAQDCDPCYPPTFYQDECGPTFILGLDLLYWYAGESGLPYAIKTITNSLAIDPNSSPGGQVLPVKYKYMASNWRPGGRATLGFHPTDGWDMVADWTYFRSQKTQDSTVPFFGEFPVVGSLALLDPYNTIPIEEFAFYFNKIKAKWSLNFNQVDLLLARKYWLSCSFNMRPYAGLRGGWTSTHFRVRATNSFVSGANTFTPDFTDKFKNKFWGTGIVAGLEPTWNFLENVALFGNVSGALLWGQYKLSDAHLSGVFRDEEPFREFISSDAKGSFFAMQSILDLAIGLRFEKFYCSGGTYLGFDLGWEHHIWFDHVYRNKPMEGLISIGTGDLNISHLQSIIESKYNLGMGGFVACLRLDF